MLPNQSLCFKRVGGYFSYQYKDHTSTKLSTGLGNNRLSYADANGNGKIETPGSTAVTLWEDDFEDKAKGDWKSVGAKYGRKITGFDTTKAKSGAKSGHIGLDGLSDGWKNRACHSNEWIPPHWRASVTRVYLTPSAPACPS